MSPAAEAILKTASALSEEERAALVERLAETLPNGAEVSRTDEWMDEVEASAAQCDEADDARLAEAIAAIRRRPRIWLGRENADDGF